MQHQNGHTHDTWVGGVATHITTKDTKITKDGIGRLLMLTFVLFVSFVVSFFQFLQVGWSGLFIDQGILEPPRASKIEPGTQESETEIFGDSPRLASTTAIPATRPAEVKGGP